MATSLLASERLYRQESKQSAGGGCRKSPCLELLIHPTLRVPRHPHKFHRMRPELTIKPRRPTHTHCQLPVLFEELGRDVPLRPTPYT